MNGMLEVTKRYDVGDSHGPTKRIRIAVAEDDPDARRALVALLGALGHDVVCAVGDGAQLIEQCGGLAVDLVIADLDMPIVDGLEAAEELSRQNVPVILLSGHPDLESINPATEPLAGRLKKPATRDSLQSAIGRALAS
jgi:CheY-like chemotaxis protein